MNSQTPARRRQWRGACTIAFGLFLSTQADAAPLVTSVEFLDGSVDASHYVAVGTFNLAPTTVNPLSTESSIFVMPGQGAGNTVSPAPDYALGGGPTYNSAATPLEGIGAVYGTALLQLTYDAGDPAATGSDLAGLLGNLPTNSNPGMFGAAGPVNRDNLSLLDAGVAAGAQVRISVDMNGEVPHLVAVMGGSYPEVTYDSDTGTLQVTGTTTPANLKNAAGESFSSTFGFMIMTQDVAGTGTTPLGIIAQTDHWVGDIFPLLPGFDDNAAVPGVGGTVGTATARCGTTVNGPTGEQRSINLFIPDHALAAMFGAGTVAADLVGVLGSPDGTVTERGEQVNAATNFGVNGAHVSFPYTFASPKDLAFAVAASNTPPSAVDDSATTAEDTAVTTANVLTNDSDGDGDMLSVSAADPASAQGGTVTNHGDGTFTYAPPANFNGSDSFGYTVSDGNGGSNSATVALTVSAVNDAPTATGDAANTTEGTAVTTGNVLVNDADVDGDILAVTAADATSAQGGGVTDNGDGTFTYTPAAGFTGVDTFTYTVSDGAGGSDTATVTVTVSDAPTNDSDSDSSGGGATGLVWLAGGLLLAAVSRRRFARRQS